MGNLIISTLLTLANYIITTKGSISKNEREVQSLLSNRDPVGEFEPNQDLDLLHGSSRSIKAPYFPKPDVLQDWKKVVHLRAIL